MGSIKSFLKRWPLLYDFLQRIYYTFRKLIEVHMLGTKVQEWIWKTRHLYKGKNWARDYCTTVNHPHRHVLIQKLKKYCLGRQGLEVGCNSGPNLYLLADKFPATQFYGIDINACAVKEGRDWFQGKGITNVFLQVGRADDLSVFEDQSMEFVFTDATLLYVGPDKIIKVLKEFLRVAKRGVVLNEWHCNDIPSSRHRHLKCLFYDGHWVYDYISLFRDICPELEIKIMKIPESVWGGEGWAEYGSIVEALICVES
jgi:ubiquinone/menaquinone biosynthesis C-methylase UbiE